MSKPHCKSSDRYSSPEQDALEIIELTASNIEDLAEAFNIINRAISRDGTEIGPLVEGEEESLLH